VVCYEYASRPIFKCKACERQFSVRSGTLFSSRKLPMRDYLMAIAIFVNGAKGVSALQLSRDLNVQYKTAFVLAHKLCESPKHRLSRPFFGRYSPYSPLSSQAAPDALGDQLHEPRIIGVYAARGHQHHSNIAVAQRPRRPGQRVQADARHFPTLRPIGFGPPRLGFDGVWYGRRVEQAQRGVQVLQGHPEPL
jgi:hypothetical protein